MLNHLGKNIYRAAYTFESEGNHILENADILLAYGKTAQEARDKALAHLLSEHTDLEESESFLFSCGSFNDCWMKTRTQPDFQEDYFSGLIESDLSVQSPGQHPGEKTWWITPRIPVYIIEIKPS